MRKLSLILYLLVLLLTNSLSYGKTLDLKEVGINSKEIESSRLIEEINSLSSNDTIRCHNMIVINVKCFRQFGTNW